MRILLAALFFAGTAFAETSVKPPQLRGMLSSEISAANDLMQIWDSSAGLLKKITLSQLDNRWSGGGGGGGSVEWGNITGTLSSQSDLQSALNAKQNTLSLGNLTSSTTGLSVTGGSGSIIGSGVSLAIQTATSGQPGLLSASDHAAFSAKQAAGNYVTALTGDVSASGPGSVAATVNSVGGSTAANIAAAEALANAATALNTNSAIVKRDSSGNFAAGTITAALTGNAATASALAANPSDCGSNTYATTIAANGNLTCSSVARAGVATGTASHVLINDGSGNLSSEATLAKSRGGAGADMSSVTFPSSGTIITTAASGLVESYTGHIETAANKTYVLDEYASFAKQITNIRIKCASGTITAALQIGGSNITTCNGISVSSTAATTTCDTGSSNDLAANGRLTLVTTSNSSCVDLSFTVKTTRD